WTNPGRACQPIAPKRSGGSRRGDPSSRHNRWRPVARQQISPVPAPPSQCWRRVFPPTAAGVRRRRRGHSRESPRPGSPRVSRAIAPSMAARRRHREARTWKSLCKGVEHANIVATGRTAPGRRCGRTRSEEHTSELQSLAYLVCRLLLEKKKKKSICPPLFQKKRKKHI